MGRAEDVLRESEIIPNDLDHVQENDLVVISEWGQELLSFLYTGVVAGLSREQVSPPPFPCQFRQSEVTFKF
jgi:hypothetical protein